jgi:hypothetical protein
MEMTETGCRDSWHDDIDAAWVIKRGHSQWIYAARKRGVALQVFATREQADAIWQDLLPCFRLRAVRHRDGSILAKGRGTGPRWEVEVNVTTRPWRSWWTRTWRWWTWRAARVCAPGDAP